MPLHPSVFGPGGVSLARSWRDPGWCSVRSVCRSEESVLFQSAPAFPLSSISVCLCRHSAGVRPLVLSVIVRSVLAFHHGCPRISSVFRNPRRSARTVYCLAGPTVAFRNVAVCNGFTILK